MIILSILLAALPGVCVLSELVLRGTKLQTGLARVLAVWGGVYVAVLVVLSVLAGRGYVAFTIFWGGAFLSWFGVRSHIESSILMRMMFLLRQNPMTAGQLLNDYQSHYGESMRMDELERGGLIARRGAVAVTRKGRAILRIVSFLR